MYMPAASACHTGVPRAVRPTRMRPIGPRCAERSDAGRTIDPGHPHRPGRASSRRQVEMNSIVIYGSRFGNTQRIAEAIAGVLQERGSVRLLPAEEASSVLPRHGDLLVVGGPTEGHTLTPAVRRYLEALRPHGLWGVKAAAFDTRVGWPRW